MRGSGGSHSTSRYPAGLRRMNEEKTMAKGRDKGHKEEKKKPQDKKKPKDSKSGKK